MLIQQEAQDGSNWEYLCTLLKDLLTIPHDNLVGRTMWRLITRTANRVVTSNMREDIETLTNADLLDLIGKKQILDEKFDSIRAEESHEEQYRNQIRELQDQIDLAKISQHSPGVIGTNSIQTKAISDIIAQVSEFMDVKYMRNDPTYSKYFAMCESGVPLDEVIRMCRKDAVDERVVRGPSIVLTLKSQYQQKLCSSKQTETLNDHIDPTPAPAPVAPPSDPNNPRNDPALKKWFKLLDMGIPKEHLIPKIEAEGLDSSFIVNAEPLGSQPVSEPIERETKPQSKPVSAKAVKKEEYNPPKPKRKPEAKLKSLFWDPVVGDALRNSVWEKFHDDQVPLDCSELCRLFRAKENVVLNQCGGVSDPSVRQPTEIVQLITDEKRLRNVGMSIARLKLGYDTLRESILRVDDSILTEDLLRMLQENAPTEAEIGLVQSYTGNTNLLNDVDRFFITLSTIPQLSIRLKNLRLRQELRNDLNDLKLDFEMFQMGMSRLATSSKLTQLLEMILAVGNYLNGHKG